MKIPILDEDNQVIDKEFIDFNKYRLYTGYMNGGKTLPPGQNEFNQAAIKYAYNMFQKEKSLRLLVENVWGNKIEMHISTMETFTKYVLPRAVQAFIGKGTPEEVQLTLQLAARTGIATKGLQEYCDEKVDKKNPRLGLDCNGFVGNYLRYRNSAHTWDLYKQPKSTITDSTMIWDMVKALGTAAITNADDLLDARCYVMGLVGANGEVINQVDSNGGFAHVIISEALAMGKREVRPPVPKQYVIPGVKYVHLSTLEATPSIGLGFGVYSVLDINRYGVATVFRGNVTDTIMKVKIYPV
jgi:hypothetical protein